MLLSNRFLNATCPVNYISGLAPHANGLTQAQNVALRLDGFGTLASIPRGYGSANTGLAMPLKPGAMSSKKRCNIVLTGSADGELGFPRSGSSSITIAATGGGALIASGSGTATITFDASGDIAGIIGSVGTASIVIDGSANVYAVGYCSGFSSISFDGSADIYAIGYMSGTTDTVTELTVDAIVSGVWGAQGSAFNEPGSMGNKLNTASSGGVDMEALAAAVWSAESAEDVLRMLEDIESSTGFFSKVLKNKREMDQQNLTVYDDNGTTPILQKALSDINGNPIATIAAGIAVREAPSSV